MTALAIVDTAILLLVVLLVFGLLRSHAAILRRLHELEGDGPGRSDPGPAPVRLEDPASLTRPVSGETLEGEQVVLATSRVDHDTILVFLSSGCLTCREFWTAFAGDGVTLPPNTRLVIVTKDLAEESPAQLMELRPRGIDLVCASSAWEDYQVPGSPYVIAISGATGRIQGEGTGMSWEQVAGLLAQATGDRRYLLDDTTRELPKPTDNVEREERVDRELMRAGIMPGDPSLYPNDEAEP